MVPHNQNKPEISLRGSDKPRRDYEPKKEAQAISLVKLKYMDLFGIDLVYHKGSQFGGCDLNLICGQIVS